MPKRLAWADFFSVYAEPMVTYQIIPDRTAKNLHIDVITRAAADMYTLLPKRFKFRCWHVTYETQESVAYDVLMKAGEITFYISVPERRWPMFQQKLEAVWPKATYRLAEIPKFQPEDTNCAEMQLKEHDLYALKTSKNTNDPLNNMLQAVKDLREGDMARVNVLATPRDRSLWEHTAIAGLEKHRKGKTLHRLDLSGMGMFNLGLRMVDAALSEVHSFLSEFMFGKKPPQQDDTMRRYLNAKRQLQEATLSKVSQPVFDTDIRIMVQSQDRLRAETAVNSIANSFKDLTSDNELMKKTVAKRKRDAFVQNVQEFKRPIVKVNGNVLGVAELSKFFQVPGADLQEQFSEIANVSTREVEIPAELTTGGIPMGIIRHKGREYKVFWPVSNHDELCMGRVIIGKQGSGKTTHASNFAVGAIEQGFSVFVHDVADGKLCDDVRDGLPKDFPEDHIIEIDLGNLEWPVGIDWYDSANRSTGRTADRIASELAGFLERFTEETGGRTRRWLKKAAQAVYSLPDSTLIDVLLMLCSKPFRRKVYPRLTDQTLIQAWRSFDSMTDQAQQQIVQPVLNRIDYLLDDTSLKNILCQQPNSKLDFRKWADGDGKPYCILIRVPKAILGATATDYLMTYINTKLWLAVLTRIDTPLDQRRPCFAIYDEPHQFPGITARAMEQFAEGRKWRLGNIWCFHNWEQLDRRLSYIMQATGPHYVLYTTSKHTWQSLSEEISPFTIEEALEIPRFSAVVCMTSNTRRVTPFLMKACPPVPSTGNRSHIRQFCAEKYGRPLEQVERQIEQAEQVFYKP